MRHNPDGEIGKAHLRRLKENWYDTYCPEDKSGIDIGCQHSAINETFRRWDIIFGDGDATLMETVSDDKFWTVHASHILEHLDDPVTALKNWYRILKPGGNLIVLVPHRDLYERKEAPPSNWNFEHKSFWVPESSDRPGTNGLRETILKAIPEADIISFRVIDDGFDYSLPWNTHAVGEYSIEAIIRKPQ
jgi:SAM-dependent methyltransferase